MSPKPLVTLYKLNPQELTIQDIIDANRENRFIEYFKLTGSRPRSFTHEELISRCAKSDVVTANEIDRLVNVVSGRPTDLEFDDETFSFHLADSMGGIKLERAKRLATYRVGIQLSIGAAMSSALLFNPELASTKVEFKFKISGSSVTQMRRVNGAVIRIHAPSTAFAMVPPDIEARRRTGAFFSKATAGFAY